MTKIFRKKNGFSFIEVMVTVCVLAFGLVGVYQAFFTSLNYIDHMTYRIHAMTLLDNQIEMLQKQLELKGELYVGNLKDLYLVKINNRPINYIYEIALKDLEDSPNVYQLDLSIKWKERARNIRISRSVYIFDPGCHDEI